MSIQPGAKLGRYEILSQLGQGGMGEVYRARDEKLNRDVAIKVLPASFSQDVDRLRRFEQEAQAAGTLNHPNILAVYDVGTHEGAPYIVTELLEGSELREQLQDGALAPRKAIDYAQQIAHGLAAAHEKRIVHRDLKPENLFVTTYDRVKILDFGLAKLRVPPAEDVRSEIDTRKQITDPGTVMGTVAYMSPEQVRGQPADHRSDIFSFGSILYEMLSGRRAFRRDTMAETMTAILKEEPPDVSESNPKINPALERIVRRCLEKQPARRFQTATDLAFALESVSGSHASNSFPAAASGAGNDSRHLLAWATTAVFALALIASIAIGFTYLKHSNGQAISGRFPISMPAGAYPVADMEEHNLAISPNGQYLAFVAYVQGKRTLWVRPIGSLAAQELPGTDDAYSVFWSPDSKFIAFFADSKLLRVEPSGKSLQSVCNLPSHGDSSGTWGSAGTIVFSQDAGGKVYRVPANGGTPSLLFADESGRALRWVQFLSDGRRFIFCKRTNREQTAAAVYAGSIDSAETKQIEPMPPTRAVFTKGGYLLYARDQTLVAQAFDEKNLRLTGEPVVIVEHIPHHEKSGWCEFSASDNSELAYMTEFPQTRLAWFDRGGREIGQVGAPGNYNAVRLAPDGQRAALDISGERSFSDDLWIEDLTRGTRTPFASGTDDEGEPVWSPDGKQLAYFSCCDDVSALHMKNVSDTGKGEMPIKDQWFITPQDWSRDGRYFIYGWQGNIWVLPMSGEAKPYLLIKTPFTESDSRLSSDGRWLAFVSNETGRDEVYVTRFDHPDEKWHVSTDGGSDPRWGREGQELFYLSPDKHLMLVPIKPGDKFDAGVPRELFKADPQTSGYDVAADGQRFLFVVTAPGAQLFPFAVITNWMAELKQ